jgi:hypothetical protein
LITTNERLVAMYFAGGEVDRTFHPPQGLAMTALRLMGLIPTLCPLFSQSASTIPGRSRAASWCSPLWPGSSRIPAACPEGSRSTQGCGEPRHHGKAGAPLLGSAHADLIRHDRSHAT